MGSQLRVLILWADDRSANLGVRALAQGAASMAREVWGDDIELHFQDLAPNAQGFSVSIDRMKLDIGRKNGPIKSWLRQFDAVIDTGAGDSFTNIYGRERFLRMIYAQVMAQRLKIPVIMAPQTVGPFTTKKSRIAAKYALKRMALVTVRDSTSDTYVKSLGRASDVLATDVVFALPQPRIEKTRDVIFNVSGLLWAENTHVDSVAYQSHVRQFISALLERGRSVTLLAHVLHNKSKDNDTVPMAALSAEFGDRIESVLPEDLEEVREVVASGRLVVGSRMHACLNALSVGTPSIPWAYSRKFAPLMADIGWPHNIDLRESTDPTSATLAIVDAVSEAEMLTRVSALRSETDRRTADFLSALRDVRV
jgi:colanic acid/amylovoran biosynthesis protein